MIFHPDKLRAVLGIAERWTTGQIGKALVVTVALAALWLIGNMTGRSVYILAGIAALATLLLLIKYPIIGACLSAFSITSSISIFLPRTVSVSLLGTTVAILIRKLWLRDLTWRITRVAKWGILMVAWWTFSILWGNYYDYFSFENFYRVVLVVLVFSEVIQTPEHYVGIVMAAGAGIALTAATTVGSVIEFFHGGAYVAAAALTSGTRPARFEGHWADFNYMALAVVPFVGITFAVLRTRTKMLLRIVAGVFLVCGIVTVFLSLSRAGILCLIIMFTLIMIADKRKLIWLLSLLLVIGILLFVLPVDVGGRLGTLAKPSGDASLQQRTQLATSGLKAFSEHWLLGIGMSNFRVSSSDYMWNLRSEMLAHNSFLEVGVESGIVGLLLLCGSLWAAFARTKPRGFRIESNDFARTLFVCQSAAVISVVFGMTTLSAANFIPLWLLFALCGVARSIFEESHSSFPMATVAISARSE